MMAFSPSPRQPFLMKILLLLVSFAPVASLGTMLPRGPAAKPPLKTLRMLELITPFGQERFATLFYVFSGARSGFVLRDDVFRPGGGAAKQYRVPSSVLPGRLSSGSPEVCEGVSALSLKFSLQKNFGMVLQHIKFLHADSGVEVSETHHVSLPGMIMCRPGNKTPLERWMLVVGGEAPGPAELAAEAGASEEEVTFADVSREIRTLLLTTSSPRRGTALVPSAASGGASLSRAFRLLDGEVFGAALRGARVGAGFLQADQVDEILVLALEKTKTFAGLMRALLRLHGNDPSVRSTLERVVEDLVELTKSRKGPASTTEETQRSSRLRKFGINALVAVAFARDPEFVRRRSLWSRGPAVFTCSRCLPQTPLQRDDLPDEALLLKILPAFEDLLEDLFVARAADVPGGADDLRTALTFGNPAAETEEDSGALFWLLQDAPEQKLVVRTIGQWLTAYVMRSGSVVARDNETGGAEADVRGAVEVLVRLLVSKVEEVVGAAVGIVQRSGGIVGAAQLFLEEMPPLLDVIETNAERATKDLLRPLVTSVGAGIRSVLAEFSDSFQRRTQARRGDHPTREISEELALLSWEQISALQAIVDRIEVVRRQNQGVLGRFDVETLRLSAETVTAFHHMVAARKELVEFENERLARVEKERVLLKEREALERTRAAPVANEAVLERARAPTDPEGPPGTPPRLSRAPRRATNGEALPSGLAFVPSPMVAMAVDRRNRGGGGSTTSVAMGLSGGPAIPAGPAVSAGPAGIADGPSAIPKGPADTRVLSQLGELEDPLTRALSQLGELDLAALDDELDYSAVDSESPSKRADQRLRYPRRATNGEPLPRGLAFVPSPMAVENRQPSGGSTTSVAMSPPVSGDHADDPLTHVRRQLGGLDLAALDDGEDGNYSAVDSESPSKRADQRLRYPRRATNGEPLPRGLAFVPSPMAVENRQPSGGSTTSVAMSVSGDHADDPLTRVRRQLGGLDLAALELDEELDGNYSAVDSESPSKRPRTGTASAARPPYHW